MQTLPLWIGIGIAFGSLFCALLGIAAAALEWLARRHDANNTKTKD